MGHSDDFRMHLEQIHERRAFLVVSASKNVQQAERAEMVNLKPPNSLVKWNINSLDVPCTTQESAPEESPIANSAFSEDATPGGDDTGCSLRAKSSVLVPRSPSPVALSQTMPMASLSTDMQDLRQVANSISTIESTDSDDTTVRHAFEEGFNVDSFHDSHSTQQENQCQSVPVLSQNRASSHSATSNYTPSSYIEEEINQPSRTRDSTMHYKHKTSTNVDRFANNEDQASLNEHQQRSATEHNQTSTYCESTSATIIHNRPELEYSAIHVSIDQKGSSTARSKAHPLRSKKEGLAAQLQRQVDILNAKLADANVKYAKLADASEDLNNCLSANLEYTAQLQAEFVRHQTLLVEASNKNTKLVRHNQELEKENLIQSCSFLNAQYQWQVSRLALQAYDRAIDQNT